MTSASRQLILVRHAKAAEPRDGQADHDRPLTQRGHADAEALGHWFKEQGLRVDLVLCSTAVRTRETWADVVASSGLGALVANDQRIYNASVQRLLGVIAEEGGPSRSIAVVGHAPGMPGLAAALIEGAQVEEGGPNLEGGYPTCTAAVLQVAVKWKDLAPGTARLSAIHTARTSGD
ncbi:phosphohistidine phosphatase [Flexivirga endophytica]|uniref:Phosphohistidine phosphatase n=1 Tax=Flexivirga endophytica TaxID=1849103 RepID=A0A916SVH4_9MICO|nr:histidine phosphatase family protein [Flexivirga endophytica]GGB16049.1 phosphohistidine phosphatase [Flexivirga endophytica]GHB39566.1 phosphohistidine phosphatase [Flexivirga endophytica]